MRLVRLSGCVALALMLECPLPAGAQARATQVPVAAASDLRFVLADLSARFERSSPYRVAITLGSSGNLVRQIQQGAPFELFLSADESLAQRLVESGQVRDAGTVYAIGHLVIYASTRSTVPLDPKLTGLREQLGSIRALAIANPEHAPYGRAARQALERAGLWSAAQPKLVLGESVSQAAQFVMSGSAQAGLVALSLARSRELSQAGRHVELDPELYAPLRQRMVLMKDSREGASAFYEFLRSGAARSVFVEYGFSIPER